MLGETLAMLALGAALVAIGWLWRTYGIDLQEAAVALIRGKRVELSTIDTMVARIIPVLFLTIGAFIFLFALLLLVLMAIHAVLST